MKEAIKKEIKNLQDILAKKPNKQNVKAKIKDYGYGKIDFHKRNIETTINRIRNLAFALACGCKEKDQQLILTELFLLLKEDFSGKLPEVTALIDKIKEKRQEQKLSLPIPKLPSEIRPDVSADIKELERSFNSGCFRAATILCGRILETTLHRKYYETTGNDLLEKNPGIGLGKIIAKMSDKNIAFDPGITQQIHLINQARIHSVHVKRQSFYPSRQQTYAMILYTLDVISKMF